MQEVGTENFEKSSDKISIRRSDGKPFDLPIGTFGHVLGKLHARFYNREVKNLHHQRFKFHM
jgi:hypothetical protein